jgi:hypothetical protein
VNGLALALLFMPVLAWSTPPEWQQNLSPSKPGPFPNPPPLRAKYRFGWMALTGGAAEAVLTKPHRGILKLEVSGGSIGLVRKLWKLDATHEATAQASSLRPIRVKQIEDYGWDKITTDLKFTDKGITFQRSHASPSGAAPQRQQFSFPNIYDLQTALYYVRSQRLQPGDEFNIVVFPGNTPYLANIHVLDRENIQVQAGKYDALKFDIHLQKISPQLTLLPHTKFKHAYVWLSDDADRVLLRVEAEIFVGRVWMELESLKVTRH